ncbi:MAG: hypothetical protein M1821_007913 [Bathelium mastoideum]|nr:MAG: hypothetical protein M1821_007913 [Bathelium mastoideum]
MTGNFCGNYSTVPPRPNAPTEVAALGTTFTSGTAYLSYPGVSAVGAGGGQCGKTYPAGFVALPSSSVSSYRLPPWEEEPVGTQSTLFPFNFADLPPNPVPAQAWSSQLNCIFPTALDCSTITEADYAPWISYPPYFKNLDPDWVSCQTQSLGVFDPPYVLTAANVAAVPAPGPATITSAQNSASAVPAIPASSPSPLHPTETSSVQQGASVNAPEIPTDPTPDSSGVPGENGDPDGNGTPPKSTSLGGNGNSQGHGNSGPSSTQGSNDGSGLSAGTGANSNPGVVGSQAGHSNAGGNGGPSKSTQPATFSKLPASGSSSDPQIVGIIPTTAAPAAVIVSYLEASPTQEGTGKGNPALSIDATVAADPSLAASSIISNGASEGSVLPASRLGTVSAAEFTIASQTFTAVESQEPNGDPIVVAGSITLGAGGNVATISGVAVSAGSNGVIVGSTPIPLAPIETMGSDSISGETAMTQAIFTVGSSTVTGVATVDSDGGEAAVVGSSTLYIGGPSVVLEGATISQGSAGVIVSQDGQTTRVPFATITAYPPDQQQAQTPKDSNTEALAVIEATNSRGDPSIVAMGSKTLTINGLPITTDGETISAGSSGLIIVSNGRSSTESYLSSAGSGKLATATEALIAIGTQIATAIEHSGDSSGSPIIVIGSQTLTAGGKPITLAGETISADASDIIIISGEKTSTVPFTTSVDATPLTHAGSVAPGSKPGSGKLPAKATRASSSPKMKLSEDYDFFICVDSA